ncbi:MAG: uL15m family ribosomal protein, partial [Planifilum fimeticola]
NVEDLNRFDVGTVVTPELLKEKGVVKNLKDGLKVLGDGDLKVKLTVKAHKFSRTAEEKIAAAGGATEVL